MRNLWDAGIIQRILALFIITTLLGIAPRSHRVRRGFELARQFQSDNSPRTSEELASLAEQMPWRDDLWENAGHAAIAADAYAEAIEYFNEALSADHLSASGYLALGDAYLLYENLNLAIQTWEALSERHPSSEESLSRLAEAYHIKDDYAATISALKELLDIKSQVESDRSQVADIYYTLSILLAAHEPESAPPYLLQAAEYDPDVEDLTRELGFVIQRALPKDEPAYTLLASGQKLAQHKQWEHAAHAFQQATQLRPDYAEAWAYLGEAYQHTRDQLPYRGLYELEIALTLDPDSLAANTFMALFWQRNGEYQQAQEYLTSAADLDPYNATLQIHIGEMWAQAGDLATAQTFYEKAIELDPYDPTSYQALVEFCIRYNVDLRGIALPAARQAVSLTPNDPASLDVMGQVLSRLGDYINAERYYLRALQHDNQFPPTHLHLGLLYTLQGQRKLAQSHLSLAISLAPNTPTAEHAQRLLQENQEP